MNKELINKLFDDRKYNELLIELNDSDKILYFLNYVLVDDYSFLTSLDKDGVNKLLNNIYKVNKDNLRSIFNHIKYLPDWVRDNFNFIIKNDIKEFYKLDYLDCYFVLRKYHESKSYKFDNFIYILSNFDINVIIKLVNNYDLFISKELILEKLAESHYSFSSYYFNKDNFKVIKTFNDKIKKRVILNLNYKSYKYGDDNDFIKIVSSIKSEDDFREIIYFLEGKIDTNLIEGARRKYLRSHIKFYNNNELTDSVIGYLFGDYYHNVKLDISEMINYDHASLVDNDHIKFYKLILELNDLSDSEKLNIFDKFKFLDIKSMFYDDLRLVKDDCYQRLMNNNVCLNDDILDKSLTKEYNWNVYRLDGMPFKALVKCFRKTVDFDIDEIMDSRDGFSFSIISSTNFGTIDKGRRSYTLLFDNLDYKNIVHVNTNDSYSDYNRTYMDYASSYQNEIKDPDKFLFNTNFYNELVIAKNKSLTPTAFICYESVTSDDVILAKKLHLPILVIEKSKYKENKSSVVNFDDILYRR